MDNFNSISSGQNDDESYEISDFLGTAIATPNEELEDIGNCTGKEAVLNVHEIQSDIQELNKTELRKKYRLEYKRWDNMKQRRKKGAIIDPRFEKFTDFLGFMGTVPNKAYTLDRIDNNNSTYSPENCRWADKYTQNSNKGNNVYVICGDETKTIAQWAKVTNQNQSTLYMRKKNGWSDEEIVTGDREQNINDPWRSTPWPIGRELVWEGAYQKVVLNGEDFSRLEFLKSTAETKLQNARLKLSGFDSYPEDSGECPALEKLENEVRRWEAILVYAREKSNYLRLRKSFVERNGSKKQYQEAILFDLVHGDNPFDYRPDVECPK